MKNSVFLIFILILFSGLLAMHSEMQRELNPMKRMSAQIAGIEKAKKQADFRAQLEADKLNDFKNQVATLLPKALQNRDEKTAYPLRQLASVVSLSDALQIERASGLFEKGKDAFRKKDFEESNALFEEVIRRYPDSVHMAEAHFLLAEGQYQSKDYEASVGTIEQMVTLFPESDLTGFALLRLGRIFETQDRLEDAGDIYRAVLSNFKQPELVSQAKSSLKSVAL